MNTRMQHLGCALAACGIGALAVADGGYHPRIWLPVAALLVAGAALLLLRLRWGGLFGPSRIAMGAGLALTLFAAISISWAWYSRHLAWDETNRLLMYVAAFAIGAGLVRGDAFRARLAAWWGAGLSVLAGWVLLEMWHPAEEPLGALARPGLDIAPSLASGAGGIFGIGGRLDWPTGYSNASAALWLCGLVLMLGAATAAAVRARNAGSGDSAAGWSAVAGIATAAATACGACFVLTQSRGGFVAAAVAVPVLMLVAGARATALLHAAVVAAAVGTQARVLTEPLVSVGALRDIIYGVEGDHAAAAATATAAIARAGAGGLTAAAIAGVVAAAATFAMAMAARRIDADRAHGVGRAVVIVAGAGAAVALVWMAGPVTGWVERQVDGCRSGTVQPAAQLADERTRLAEVGSNRCDFWKVAARTGSERPLTGLGANNFQGAYLLLRDSAEQPRQAHSLPLDTWASLGLLGVVALATWLLLPLGAVAGRLHAEARDPAAPLVGAAATVYVAWLVQASLDWLWNMPAVTLPLIAMAGSLTATGALHADPRRIRPVPALVAAGVVFAVVVGSMLPQAQADHLERQARRAQFSGAEPAEVHRFAAAAAAADPTWAQPQALAAQMLATAGDSGAARAAAADAVAREPRNWTIRRQAGCILARTGARAAEVRREFEAAARLNPGFEPPDRLTRRPEGC